MIRELPVISLGFISQGLIRPLLRWFISNCPFGKFPNSDHCYHIKSICHFFFRFRFLSGNIIWLMYSNWILNLNHWTFNINGDCIDFYEPLVLNWEPGSTWETCQISDGRVNEAVYCTVLYCTEKPQAYFNRQY